jgi:transposase-like protein
MGYILADWGRKRGKRGERRVELVSDPEYSLQNSKKSGEEKMAEIIIRRYSVAFKRQVVSQYEAGASLNELKQRYGIGGSQTVNKWVNKYGREGMRHKLMMIQQPEEQLRVKELEKQLREMKDALAHLTLDKFMLECCLEVAEDELGHEVKKKSVTRSWTKLRSG